MKGDVVGWSVRPVVDSVGRCCRLMVLSRSRRRRRW